MSPKSVAMSLMFNNESEEGLQSLQPWCLEEMIRVEIADTRDETQFLLH